jgi:arabinan endo-1,5-alpha-L-arabinosidase
MQFDALGSRVSPPGGDENAIRNVASLLALLVALNCAPAWAQMGDVQGVHDPCIIREGDFFYLYATGRGIPISRSPDLFTWERIGRVFETPPAWAAQRVKQLKSLWAPDVARVNRRFYLFYSVSTFGSNNSSIGVASSKSLDPQARDYGWTDHGEVIRSVAGKDNWNAIDPQFVANDGDRNALIFGSFLSGIKLAPVSRTMPPRVESDKLLPLARRPGSEAIEAPMIFKRGDDFFLLTSWDFCCRGKDSTYQVVAGRSRSLLGPYLDRSGKPLLQRGGTPILAGYGRWRGPGHCDVIEHFGTEWLVHHVYDADDDGKFRLQIRPFVWDRDGWPLVGEPLAAPPLEPAKTRSPLKVVGKWRHFVSGGPEFELTIREGGELGGESRGTWKMSEGRLVLRFPARKAPGGAFVNDCIVDPHGKWYVARDAQGALIRGIRLSDSVGE